MFNGAENNKHNLHSGVQHLASFPGLPRFLFFHFCVSYRMLTRCLPNNKNGRGLGTVLYNTHIPCKLCMYGEGHNKPFSIQHTKTAVWNCVYTYISAHGLNDHTHLHPIYILYVHSIYIICAYIYVCSIQSILYVHMSIHYVQCYANRWWNTNCQEGSTDKHYYNHRINTTWWFSTSFSQVQ